jgi:phosphatidylinositol kinase/protein kinase (PI-3  family)
MRHSYTASLAATSAWGYLVGLGDRHLGNLLVVRSTAAIVPIDFGYAFGTAVMVRYSPVVIGASRK